MDEPQPGCSRDPEPGSQKIPDYGTWSLVKLRAELRKRSAKLSGRKEELVQRLQAYERNKNFGNIAEPIDEYSMILPDVETYKDINTNTKMPKVSLDSFNEFLSHHDKILSQEKPDKIYSAGFVMFIRSSLDNGTFYFRGQCRAEMRKNTSYIVDIALEEDGTVVEAQCECAAGVGPQAHCKHITAIMFALFDFVCHGKLVVELTCTQKLQKFHRVKRFFGSPVKSRQLPLKRARPNRSTLHFDPRCLSDRNNPSYNDMVNNLTLNYCNSQFGRGMRPMPIMQLSGMANPYALELDHDYGKKTLSELFLDNIGVSSITPEQIVDTELDTRGQAENSAWERERCYRLHASNFGRICKATDRTDFDKLSKSLVTVRKLKAASVLHGKVYEAKALKEYEKLTSLTVKHSGIVISSIKPYLACSPDGIVSDRLIVEVKCPYSSRNKAVNVETVPYLFLDECNGDLALDSNHDYYYQIQGQLFVTDRPECDFVVFTLVDCKVITVRRNEQFINDMVAKLQKFYDTYFKPCLLNNFFYRNY